jgi:hypothetical protein
LFTTAQENGASGFQYGTTHEVCESFLLVLCGHKPRETVHCSYMEQWFKERERLSQVFEMGEFVT